jgi:hypothetical protein
LEFRRRTDGALFNNVVGVTCDGGVRQGSRSRPDRQGSRGARGGIACGATYPSPWTCSIPNNHTGLRAEGLRDVVTIAELRTAENEKAREKGSIAGVNKSGEKIVGLFVDSECMSLEDHLHGAIYDREDDVCHSDGGCGDPLPLKDSV